MRMDRNSLNFISLKTAWRPNCVSGQKRKQKAENANGAIIQFKAVQLGNRKKIRRHAYFHTILICYDIEGPYVLRLLKPAPPPTPSAP